MQAVVSEIGTRHSKKRRSGKDEVNKKEYVTQCTRKFKRKNKKDALMVGMS